MTKAVKASMTHSAKSFLVRHRKIVALIASMGLHIAIIALFFLPASGTLSPLDQRLAGTQDQDGIDVTLFQPEATGMDRSTPKPKTSALESFRDVTDTSMNETWQPSDTPKSTRSLAEVFGTDVFADAPQQAKTPTPSDQQSHIKASDHDRKSMNDLWKAIAPCWKRIADKNTTSVTLSVSFSPLGNLSKPPVIVRQPGAILNDQRLRSESLAITALSQCGPYLMAFGQSDVGVSFPAGG